jgi:hypothetical protein
MKPSHLARITVLAAVAVSWQSTAARAEFFEYNTSVTIVSVNAGSTSPNSVVNGPSVLGQNNSTISTPANPATDPTYTLISIGDTSLLGGNHFNASSPPGTDITLGHSHLSNLTATMVTFDFNFSIVLTVTDYSTANAAVPTGTGTVLVSGRIVSQDSSAQQNTSVFSYATTPANGIFTAGASQYELIRLGFTAPSFDHNGNETDGDFTAHLNSPPSVPEPTAMALLGIGGAFGFGLFRSRKRRV